MGAGSSQDEGRVGAEDDARADGRQESDSIYRLIHNLIRTGAVSLNSANAAGEESSESDEEEPLSLKEALESTESLMMGGRRRKTRSPDLSQLQRSDLRQMLELGTGATGVRAGRRPSLWPGDALRNREIGMLPNRNGTHKPAAFSAADRVRLHANFMPNRKRLIAKHRTKTFCSQFSADGNILITASQDRSIRFYKRGPKDRWYQYDEIIARDVGWSILDVALSPDGQHLIYGTWSDYIHEFSLYGPEGKMYQAYNLESPDYRSNGSEILAGASDRRLYVYDREYKKLMLKIEAHEDDINAVCFGDAASNIVYSGGDDGLVKVWDRRDLQETDLGSGKPVGVFAGHTDGITFIDSKGDGRFLLSNSKDQSIKLWDVRRFSSSAAADATRDAVSRQRWDYRWQSVPRQARTRGAVDGDSSVVSYRGAHTVQHTLVRAYFSPAATTAQRYVYTGCARGGVAVYDLLTAQPAARLDGHNSCVRDASWHPQVDEIVSSSWDGHTLLWSFDERKRRNIHPDKASSELPGDEDSEDSDGKPIVRNRSAMMRKASMGRKRIRATEPSSSQQDSDSEEAEGADASLHRRRLILDTHLDDWDDDYADEVAFEEPATPPSDMD